MTVSYKDAMKNYKLEQFVKQNEDQIKKKSFYNPYQDWHSKLGHNCVIFDIDGIEFRNNEPVAIIELTEFKYPHVMAHWHSNIINQRAKYQIECISKIAKKLETKFYYVIHNEEMTLFIVNNIFKQKSTTMNQQQYRDFITKININ